MKTAVTTSNGTSQHFGRVVMEFFKEDYEGTWIGRSGLVAWPASSPDFFVCVFALSGECLKVVHHNQGVSQ
jgi:hypothetical protein